jgi:3',5'-cyclic AMP phosphodiesterase CpdA
MSTTRGTLLSANAYTPAAATAARAARAAYESGQPATASLPKSAPLIAVVGDMVSDPDNANRDQEEGSAIASRFRSVADLIVGSHCTFFSCLGDNVYENGQLSEYNAGYADTFGRLDSKCLPVAGNHEYQTPGGADFFTYFGQRAGVAGQGWFATNVANWRFYVLNSNSVSLVAAGSPQLSWLATDLAAHPNRPKIVAWHHPRWTDGGTSVSDDNAYDPLWQLLYTDGSTQIVLAGHDHNYQRWDTIRSAGTSTGPVTVSDGITQFVVGCGGNNFFTLVPPRPGLSGTNLNGGPGNTGRSTYGHDRAFGALFLRLGPASYDWLFRSVDGVDYDYGTRATHSRS